MHLCSYSCFINFIIYKNNKLHLKKKKFNNYEESYEKFYLSSQIFSNLIFFNTDGQTATMAVSAKYV